MPIVTIELKEICTKRFVLLLLDQSVVSTEFHLIYIYLAYYQLLKGIILSLALHLLK